MRKKRAIKLFSLSMAGILTVSSCNMAGSVVHAEKIIVKEETTEDVVEEEKRSQENEESEKTLNSSNSVKTEKIESSQEASSEEKSTSEESSSVEESENEETTIEDSAEETSAEEVVEETSAEESSEEISDIDMTEIEETTEEEIIEENFGIALLSLEDEDVTLTKFYGADVAFDSTLDWDDKGEYDLKLTTTEALSKGATVSLDVYIPAEITYNGIIKMQGIARVGNDWAWVQDDTIPEFSASDFRETVEVDGTSYKKTTVSFTFQDEEADNGTDIATAALAEFQVKLAGYQCDYTGPIYYANVKLEDGEGEVTSATSYAWDFATGIDGWTYGGVWDNGGNNSIEWSEQYQALQMNVDYSLNASSTWSEIKSSFWGDDFQLAGVNKLTYDFIYDSAVLNKGSFKTKVFSNSGVNTDVSISLDNAEDFGGTLKKVQVSVPFDETDIVNDITISIIGYETDYQGVVYLDNVKLFSEAVSEEEDIYVDVTETVTGQDMQLSVSGNTLLTGDGSSTLIQNITLVDANATDDVKQIYAYLQAVGQTNSVIFGQQNNTSHKAGNANLSVSDTMDVVGSYTGVIGLDGLSLTGDEYSAVRYINEMADEDSEYDTVVAKINAASTDAQKNVIAAAALTNFNIRNGAIATLSLHTPNFSKVDVVTAVDGAPSYAYYDFSGYTPGDLSGNVMNNILPGGVYHEEFTAYLDMVADYASKVDGAILFRPFHENTGSWFWWGAALCEAQTYKSVFKYTVEYLRDEKGIHNLLYVYGPGAEAASVEEYGERYPGDGYVDMVGFDMYHDNPTESDSFITNFKSELAVVESFAQQHGKLIAVTETGVRHDTVAGDNSTALLKKGNARPDWYQEVLEIVESSDASYYLVWANFSEKDGFYTPYVKSVKDDGTLHGHEMMDSFIRFFNQSNSIFAVNQKSALEQMQAVSVNATAAITQDGYMVSPLSGTRVLVPTSLTAKVTGVTEDVKVEFVCTGEATRTLTATVADGYAIAALTGEDLAILGEAVGTITLQFNGNTVETINALFNIPEAEADPHEIDGFENYYGLDSQLTSAWKLNKATGSSITLSLVQEPVNEGNYAMKFEYSETSDGWAGATITKEVCWAECDALRFWTIPDGNLQKTVIQITANGNVYEYYINQNEDYAAAGTRAVQVTIPFSEFVARDITGNPKGGLVDDKASITSFGLWINAIAESDAVDENGMVKGTLYFDSITAVAAGLDSVKVELVKESADSLQTGNNVTSSKSDKKETVVDTRVFPTFTSPDGKKVSGWDEVVSVAYEFTKLIADNADNTNISDSADRLMVNIDATNVTELVIPETAIQKMKDSGADYNIFMGISVITLTNEILSGIEGSFDLKLYIRDEKEFGGGFDAMFISSRTKITFEQMAYMNVVLGEDKSGKFAYIYKYNEEAHSYDLLSVQAVSEIGTVCISLDEYVSCLILY